MADENENKNENDNENDNDNDNDNAWQAVTGSEYLKYAPKFLHLLFEGDSGGFGFECGKGWVPIIGAMCREVEQLGNDGRYKGMHAVALQIKEKFAELRVYWRVENSDGLDESLVKEFYDNVEVCLKEAGRRCDETCEICGAPATTITGGWIRRVCDSCYEKWNAARAARQSAVQEAKEISNE